MTKYLLTEGNMFNEKVETLAESKDGKKFWYLEGIFADSRPNRNNRIYPEHLWEKEVKKYVEERVNRKCAYGELNHPSANAHEIDPDNVCMLMTEATWDGKEVYGKSKILETPKGLIAIAMLEGGGRVSASSRGLGNIGEQVTIEGKKVGKVASLDLICWDAVLFPSNYSCDNLKGITESLISKAYDISEGGVIYERTLSEFEKRLVNNGTKNLKSDLNKFFKSIVGYDVAR